MRKSCEDEKKAQKLIKELPLEVKGLIVSFVPFDNDNETTVGEALRLVAVTNSSEIFKKLAELYIKLLVNKGKPNIAERYGKAKKSGPFLIRLKFSIIGDIGDKVSLEFLKIDALSKKSANINYLRRSMVQHLKVDCYKISKSAKKCLFITLDNIVTFVKNQHKLTNQNFNLYQEKENLEEKLGNIETELKRLQEEKEEMKRLIYVEERHSYNHEYYSSYYGKVESKESILPYSFKGLTLDEKRITNPTSYSFCNSGYGHCPCNKKEIDPIKSLSDQKETIKKKLEQVNMLQKNVKDLLEN